MSMMTVQPATQGVSSPELVDPEAQLAELRSLTEQHPIWNCRLLKSCDAGHLTFEDLRLVFGQYYLYSKNFTRYLAAVMVNCESDYFRARLAMNLWEEGGGQDPRARHAEILRAFLRETLRIDLDALEYEGFSKHFVHSYLTFCSSAPAPAACAFLAFGTEAIVARLYRVFMNGLIQAGVEPEALRFFELHIACDDDHAATLAEMVVSYSERDDWRSLVREGVRTALDLRLEFFEALSQALEASRLRQLIQGVQNRASLCGLNPPAAELCFQTDGFGEPLYENRVERLQIDFSVERVPFGAEVLDPRLVRIKPASSNEKHRHAHESLLYVLCGRGSLRVNDTVCELSDGDVAFVPRWAVHQVTNTGTEELRLLAITDYHLTGRLFIGNYDSTARLRQEGVRRKNGADPGVAPGG